MGVRAAIDALVGVVTAADPVRVQGVRFAEMPERSRSAPSSRSRLFDLTVTGSGDGEGTGFRARRRHLVDLSIYYAAGFGGIGQESVTIAEDVAVLTVALGASNVGTLAGVAVVHPPDAHEVEPVVPEGKDSPTGLVVTVPFIIETRES
jgi:hypothetical protein